MDNDDIISTLNSLVETSRDGEEGFRTSAEHATDSNLKSLLANRAASCASAVTELQQLVRAHGGDPDQHGSISGTLHRGWVDIKSAVMGRDDTAILNEVERGEDVAVASYKKALAKNLPADAQALIERQFQGVMKNHDQIKLLRNQSRAQG